MPSNDADVRFAQGIIAQHEQAIEMATSLVEANSENPDVEVMAETMIAVQGFESAVAEDWLERWGASTEGAPDDAEGMMSESEMDDPEG